MAGIIAHTVGVIAAAGAEVVPPGPASYEVTVGGTPGSNVGYFRGVYGSISPDSPYAGRDVDGFSSLVGSSSFAFILDGSAPNGLFTKITVETAGAPKEYLAEDATFNQQAFQTSWSWPFSAGRPWGDSDIGEVYQVDIE